MPDESRKRLMGSFSVHPERASGAQARGAPGPPLQGPPAGCQGIIYRYRSGAAWRDLPSKSCPGKPSGSGTVVSLPTGRERGIGSIPSFRQSRMPQGRSTPFRRTRPSTGDEHGTTFPARRGNSRITGNCFLDRRTTPSASNPSLLRRQGPFAGNYCRPGSDANSPMFPVVIEAVRRAIASH